jgi:hypothetical protein
LQRIIHEMLPTLSPAALPIHRPAELRGGGDISWLLRLDTNPAPLRAMTSVEQRPSVLARQHRVSQQMSLFGPRGAGR